MKKTEKRYRIHNWPEYNQSLVARGSLQLWLPPEVIENWYDRQANGLPGATRVYSDSTITALLTIKAVFSLGYRQTIGMATSIIDMLGLDLQIPCYSTLCKRASALAVALDCEARRQAHIALDATGMKVFGQGEWHVRSHGASKRRTWRKVHLCVDVQTGEILAQITTENNVGDSEVVEELLQQVEGTIAQVSADGAYDTFDTHQAIAERTAKAAIPTRRGACIKKHGNAKGPEHPRDAILRGISKHGRAEWKQRSNYHLRSIVENGIGRLKAIFGAQLSARLFDNEQVEVAIKCRALNIMFDCGRPDSRLTVP